MQRVWAISALAGALVIVLPETGSSQQVGDCEHGEASQRLDVNGVSAAVYNTGSLFWRGIDGGHYNVPVGTESNALFLAQLWIGGLVDGTVKMSASDYGPWEMWPGPIDDSGNPPEDCSDYDRIYKVSRYELNELDRTGIPTKDIAEWPWRLGAPVDDGDGIPDNYDLAAGDRPGIEGDQSVWWLMNDLGSSHDWKGATPMGIEVRVTAFAASSENPDLNLTTFYRYSITNRSGVDIDSTYLGMHVEAEMGESDEFVGSDSTWGIAYFYAGDDFDAGVPGWHAGYGDRPPALGLTVVDAPVVDGETLRMTNMLIHSHDSYRGHPRTPEEAYGYFYSQWPDGEPITVGGSGYGWTDIPAPFMYPGRPPEYWSEENAIPPEHEPYRNYPGFRFFIWSTGPFDLPAGETRDVVIAIVFVQEDDRLESVYELLDAVPRVHQTYADGLPSSTFPVPMGRPNLVSPADGVGSQPTNLTLLWEESPYADRYEIEISTPDSVLLTEKVLGRPYPVVDASGEVTFETDMPANTDLTWRVRGLNASGFGAWSERRTFTTGSVVAMGPGPLPIRPGDSEPAFIQVQGIGDDDACGPLAGSNFGCAEVGGNNVYGSFNGQGDWVMYHQGSGPEESIGAFAPHDFEIRVTEDGSFGYHPFGENGAGGQAHRAPFDVWDIGDVGPFGVNDTLDDIRMIPAVFSDGGGVCEFAFGEIPEDPFGLGWPVTDRVYSYYPVPGSSYNDWRASIEPLVVGHPDRCPTSPATDPAAELIDIDRGRPLQRLIFMMDPTSPNYRPEMIPVGNVIRFLTTRPTPPQQSAPASNTVQTAPFTLYWQLGPGADTVRVQLLRVGEPLTIYLDQFVPGDRLRIDDIEPGLYYWRLSNGGEEWSEAWSFVGIPATSAQDDGLGIPTELELKPTYPNPSGGPRTLVFGVPQTQRVSLEVFDLLGRRVESISDGERTAGWHSERWDPKGLSAGVYFVRLESAAESRTQPIVVAR